MGLPRWHSGKASICQSRRCRRLKFILWVSGSGRSPGGGNGNALQYSCLENRMDRGAWQAIVHRVTKSRTRVVTALQCCVSFCCTTGWLSSVYTYTLSLDPPFQAELCAIQQVPTGYLFYTWSCLYVSAAVSICPTLFFPAVSARPFSLSCLYSCKYVHQDHFSRFHVCALVYDTCLSLSDLLHSVWHTLKSIQVSTNDPISFLFMGE